MTTQDFIASYNKTFDYIEDRYGTEMLQKLWKKISDHWCVHFEDCIRRDGLDGCVEYWGGDAGTLEREQAGCKIAMKDGVFSIIMERCPSVDEVRSRGQEPHVGKLTYCDHCAALYPPILAKYGLKMTIETFYHPDGRCVGRCNNYIIKESK
ncbi:MAG: hypothetical protein RRZ24_06150 [Clostridia bacterium]